jgi:hypothetical protein
VGAKTGESVEEPDEEATSDDDTVAHDLKVEQVVTFLDQFFNKGVAVTDLKDLVAPVYPSSKLDWLSKIKRIRQNAPTAARRVQPLPKSNHVSDYLQVVFFKRPNERRAPGLNEDTISSFFVSFFQFEDKQKEKEVGKTICELVANTLSMIIAITIQREDRCHIIVACIVFHPDNNVGSFVPYIAVLNEGTDKQSE